MVDKQSLYAQITNSFSEKLLNWAIKKTGSRAEGEDLAQEVFLQIFQAVVRHEHIEKLEHFVWKVARYVWCNRLRELVKYSSSELNESFSDYRDFVQDYSENDALQLELTLMRRGLADLSKIQREVMIHHYLDGLSVREVAQGLGTTESAVTWHLFDARKRIREDISMPKEKSTIYRPGKLGIGCSGEAPKYPDTEKVKDSLSRQNICLLCHTDGKTLDELSEIMGIPKPFLEYDLDWLSEHEFLVLSGKRYYTRFLIMNQNYFQNRIDIYKATKKSYIDVIISELWKQEAKIRSIGFYGSDFPIEKLYWSIIMMFTSYASRNSELLLRLKRRDRTEIRPDGGKYYVTGWDCSDSTNSSFSHFEPKGWNDFSGIWSDTCDHSGQCESYYWLGVYTFAAQAYQPEIASFNLETRILLHRVYCATLASDFSVNTLTETEKEKLAEAVAGGLITKKKDMYTPNFVIFTPEQLLALQNEVYLPLLEKLGPQMEQICEKFFKRHKRDFPKVSDFGLDWHVYVDLWNFGIYTMMFAANEGKLALPESPEQGVPLTLVLIK